jgi:dTDP-glucose pyrophosphorylase
MSSVNNNINALAAISILNDSLEKFLVVVDENNILCGTITDGDIRRGILRGLSLDNEISLFMNIEPFVFNDSDYLTNVNYDTLIENNIFYVPIVDSEKRFLKLEHVDYFKKEGGATNLSNNNCAVIMAGGKGTRLRPLTNNLPKPMVEVGGIPLIERIIENFKKCGIKDIYISVNYLADVIINYFGNGSHLGLSINYLHEDFDLDTAGALGFLDKELYENIFVINGDIITDINFNSLYDFHNSEKSAVTICTIPYKVSVPFGVIEHDNGKMTALVEKPTYTYLCNAGVYIMSNKSLKYIKKGVPLKMTDFIETLSYQHENIKTFPVHEYWSDVGTIKDLEDARKIFK